MTDKAKLGLQMRYMMQKYLFADSWMKKDHYHPNAHKSSLYLSSKQYVAYKTGRHLGRVGGMEDMLYSIAAFHGIHFRKWSALERNLRRQARRHGHNFILMDNEAALERYLDWIREK